MAGNNEPDGKNSLLGEFLLALARAPEPVQEAIILYGIKQMFPFAALLIQPYPMLSHMVSILEKQRASGDGGDESGDGGMSH